MPLAFTLTGGEQSDTRQFASLLDIGSEIQPRAIVADKAYDAKANRDLARQRGICPVIPFKSNAKHKPRSLPNSSIAPAHGSSRLSES